MSHGDTEFARAVSEHQARLSSQFLPEAHRAQEEALRHQIEQSRLVIFGALGAMAVIATAMLATDRKICLSFIELGYIFLMFTTAAGWYANSVLAACWDQTASLRFTNLSSLMAVAEGRDGMQEQLAFRTALKELNDYRSQGRTAVVLASVVGWFAFPIIFQGVRETVAGKYSASVWVVVQTWGDSVAETLSRLGHLW
ncbi:hypothetical protein [Phenylobacterium sp.]|uniref:hypothetical protein n=1 Tax=Phenylobacterium sp. TaxID=1871053 RepID=UPI0035B3F234